MTILRDISLIWTLIHVLVLFALFYESRYPRKKTLLLSCVFMTPIGVINAAGVIMYGPELMGKLLILTCTLPSLIFFFVIAKNRNWKFLFTFCVVDTVSYEVLALSKIIDFYLFGDKYIAMLVIRLVAFPLLEWLAYRYVRKPFLELKRELDGGWAVFSLVTALYYVLLLIMVHFPTMVVSRSEYVPAVLLVLTLMPLTYFGFFKALRRQSRVQRDEARYRILEIQSQSLNEKFEEIGAMEEKLRIQRHDMRHAYSLISQMLTDGKVDEALMYVSSTEASLAIPNETIYCTNPIINAVFHYYVRRAEENDIRTDMHISFPEELGVDITELSVAIANAFDNAINACIELPCEKRYIKCQSVSSPQFVFRISNPFTGKIIFDEKGVPRTDKAGHGTGVYSIITFCEKNDIFCSFTADGDTFSFSMIK